MVFRNSGIPEFRRIEIILKNVIEFSSFFLSYRLAKNPTAPPPPPKKDGPIGELGDVASGQGQSIPKPLWCPLRMTCVSHATLDRWQHELMRYGAVRVATGAILGRLAFIVIDFSCRETASF